MPSETNLRADLLRCFADKRLDELLEKTPRQDRLRLLHDFTLWGRAAQFEPQGNDWRLWLVLGGRGAGKSRTGAEWVTRGRLQWTEGANAGRAMEVRSHRREGSRVILELWQPMAAALEAGDRFIVTSGCDKQFSTCRRKFSNALNFRGFPHMPGNDFVLSYASHD